ncbi:hypothetical protein CFE70_004941 [Pyrenophora teres f. teres 0-1]
MFSKRLEGAVNSNAALRLAATDAHKRSAHFFGEALQAAKRTEEVEQERDELRLALGLKHDQEIKLRIEYQQKMKLQSTRAELSRKLSGTLRMDLPCRWLCSGYSASAQALRGHECFLQDSDF